MGPSVLTGRSAATEAVTSPIWQELLVGIEMAYLRISPIYWGYGIPRGDGSAAVVVPGFLGTDFYLVEFRSWLRRIGYKAYDSGIGLNAECPNLIIRTHLNATIERAYQATGRKVHLIGHSLGGIIARATAAQMQDRVASVISLGSPFRGVSVHPSVQRAAEFIRRRILARHSDCVLPHCYTIECTCDFLESLAVHLPKSMRQTAIYTRTDGIVDWRVCVTGDPAIDCEVSATHLGLVFNPLVYALVARRLAEDRSAEREAGNGTGNRSRTGATAKCADSAAGKISRPGRTDRRGQAGARRSRR